MAPYNFYGGADPEISEPVEGNHEFSVVSAQTSHKRWSGPEDQGTPNERPEYDYDTI